MHRRQRDVSEKANTSSSLLMTSPADLSVYCFSDSQLCQASQRKIKQRDDDGNLEWASEDD